MPTEKSNELLQETSRFSFIKKSYILPWIILFLFLNIVSRQDGATNELSRFATMRAIVEQQTFQIDIYKDWTVDWAKPSNGHYYSNKAPAPMLLAIPVFFALESITQFDRKEIKTKDSLKDTTTTDLASLLGIDQSYIFITKLTLQI